MFKVIRVHGKYINEFVAVIVDGAVVREIHGVSEFTVADVLRIERNWLDVVIGSPMTFSKYSKKYQRKSGESK